MSNLSNDFIERAKKIKLILMDCDGVLTDGKLYYSENGESLKIFHVRDGQGIILWHQQGFRSGIISGRGSHALSKRAEELGIHYLKTNSDDKAKDLDDILEDAQVKSEEVCFIGDDISDICVMRRVGLAVTVADGATDVKPYIHHRTLSNGGCGAVREVINSVLYSQNLNFDDKSYTVLDNVLISVENSQLLRTLPKLFER